MDQKELDILTAAIDVFAHYGVKRTTMHDVANAAGIARQTLYNSFANKDAILRGTIKLHAHETRQAFESYFASSPNLKKGLDVAFEHLSVQPFELICNTAHGEEILEGFNLTAREELREAYQEFRVLTARMLTPYNKTIAQRGMTVESLSDLVVATLAGFKKSAQSREHLDALYKTFKTMVLGMLEMSDYSAAD